MFVRYEVDSVGSPYECEDDLEEFIKNNCRHPYSGYSTTDGAVHLLVNLIKLLIKKNALTVEELDSILPCKNYRSIISLTEKRTLDHWA